MDPYRPDTIYSMNVNVERSTDGGKTWERTNWENYGGNGMNVHVDHHHLTFDPTDKRHMLLANDGGLYESYDEGTSWRFFANLPISAVLPGVGRQREAVLQRLRRHAGQLVALRPVAHDVPLGHAHERLVHRRGR